MERMWILEAANKYRNKFLVAVNLSDDDEGRTFGDIYMITDDVKEALAKEVELDKSGELGRVTYIAGFDDTPCIGGLRIEYDDEMVNALEGSVDYGKNVD